MISRLKDWPLSRQILSLFLVTTTALAFGVGLFYPMAIKQYLVDNTFDLLQEEFENLSKHITFGENDHVAHFPETAPYFLQLLLSNYEYTFDVAVFAENGQTLGIRLVEPLPAEDLRDLFRKAYRYAQNELQRGTLEREQETYLFVSRKMDYHGFPYYLVLFSKERELNQINAILSRQFFWVLALTLLVSWLLAGWFSRYLSQPLRKLGEWCQTIAKRQFDIPIHLDRKDEIGELARSFNAMRAQLKEYDESQRHFVQNISHELKTPIMAIRGYAQGLMDGVFQGEQAEKGLQIIMEESNRLEKVVEQLLYLTKIESVQAMYRPALLDLAEMLHDLRLRLEAIRPDLIWNVSLPESLPAVADREQLRTAFQNLLENQLRYAEKTLWLEAKETGGEIRIWIANDGPPIEESLLPHLFQRFRKGKTGKNGLGLAIARAVIEGHGGHIKASNEPPGVRFTVRLPKRAPGEMITS